MTAEKIFLILFSVGAASIPFFTTMSLIFLCAAAVVLAIDTAF